MRREGFLKEVETEIAQAKGQQRQYGVAHVITISVNIILGAITTYLLATGYGNSKMLAVCAAVITILGTFEKTFGFGAKKNLYRQVKTDFQNLRLDVISLGTDARVPEAMLETFKDIRNRKLAEG